MKRLLTTALLLVPMALALAQDPPAPKEIQDLGWMVGTWTGSGKIAFGGNETAITSTLTVSIDGQFLKAVSSDKSDMFTATKTTMTSWDPKKSEYVSYSFTNMGSTARVAHGKLDGNKLVMLAEPWEAEGMTMVMRETLSKVSDTKYGTKLEYKDGDNWVTGMDFVLTKQ